jgi:hypothetical protein
MKIYFSEKFFGRHRDSKNRSLVEDGVLLEDVARLPRVRVRGVRVQVDQRLHGRHGGVTGLTAAVEQSLLYSFFWIHSFS